MTEGSYSAKIKPEHLARKAIVYLRQSSERQVRQNKESQQLQYAVAERVRALGWKQVEIINSDLGSSSASSKMVVFTVATNSASGLMSTPMACRPSTSASTSVVPPPT
jgi:hypothetical protein